MASIVRVARQGYRLFSLNRVARPGLQPMQTLNRTPCLSRAISTSQKKKDASIVTQDDVQSGAQVEENLEAKEENWMSFGYDLVDRELDEYTHHSLLFVSITICLVGGAYVLAYYPDMKSRDWVQRESYLELARREREGLPLISRDLIDPEKIELPSEEELGEFDIVI